MDGGGVPEGTLSPGTDSLGDCTGQSPESVRHSHTYTASRRGWWRSRDGGVAHQVHFHHHHSSLVIGMSSAKEKVYFQGSRRRWGRPKS